MASNITSAVTEIRYFGGIGLQFDITSGTPTGTLTVQVSANYNEDINGNVINVGNWVNVDLTSVNPQGSAYIQIAAGQPVDTYISMFPLAAPWLRVVYSATSGSGVLQGFITGKNI